MGQLGDMLYAARREAGISLAEISTVTRIRVSVLESLEAGNYDSLPDPGYLRGFVSDYTRYVGVDPEPFLEMLEHETGRRRVDGTPSRRRPAKTIGRQPQVSTKRRPHEVHAKPLIIALAALIVVGLSVWLAYSLWPKGGEVTPAPAGSGSQATTATASAAIGAPFTVEVYAKKGSASDVRLIVDGLLAYDDNLTSSDEPLAYDVVSSAEISVSNPTKVEVFVNGTAVPIDKADTPVTLTAPSTK